MNKNYYAFAAFGPKNLTLLTEEWFAGLNKEWRTEETRKVAHEMANALSERLFRDGTVLNVSHGDFTAACLTLMGGASCRVLHAHEDTSDRDSWAEALLCANLYARMAAKLYHRDKGKYAVEIVREAGERALAERGEDK